ncbi:MAG: RsmD family RNA methyltransferase [Victivallaceae bacterium]|nr:RsmD family RNA methyltransferase [Victivallaceae bacterium]
MKIISGIAKSIVLTVPPGVAVRPTAARARKALFDSLGIFTGAKVADLFAGSGALGLEAASRGAAKVIFVENLPAHCAVIEANAANLAKAGVSAELTVIRADVLSGIYRRQLPEPDFIFADPPYPESAAFFARLLADREFVNWTAGGRLVWEIPSFPGAAGGFMNPPAADSRIREFGGTRFLIATVGSKNR